MKSKKLNKEDFYHQFHNFQAINQEHADDRPEYHKNGEVTQVGPPVHFRRDHAKKHQHAAHVPPKSGADAVQHAVYIARQHKRGRP